MNITNILRRYFLTLLQVAALVAIFQLVAVTTPSVAVGPSAIVTNMQYDAHAKLV